MKASMFNSNVVGEWHCFNLCAEGVHLTVADHYDASREKVTVHRSVIVDGKCNCSSGHQMELDQEVINLIKNFHNTGIAGEEWLDEFDR